MKAEIFYKRNEMHLKRDKAMLCYVRRQEYDRKVKLNVLRNASPALYKNYIPYRHGLKRDIQQEI